MGRTRDRIMGRARRKAAALALAAALILPPRSASSQIYCEPFFVTLAVQEIIVFAQSVLIDQIFMPPGAEWSLPGLLRQATTQAMYLVGGGEYVTIQVPGLQDAISMLEDVPIIGSAVASAIPSEMRGDRPVASAGGPKFHVGGLGYMDSAMRARLDAFWNDLHGALRSMTAQIQASDANTGRMLAAIFDSSSMARSAIDNKLEEVEARTENPMNEMSCRFDTFARGIASAQQVTRAVAGTYSRILNDLGQNKAGTISARGPAAHRQARFREYIETFCDSTTNAGFTPCAENQPLANAAVSPAKTLFEHPTINLADANTRKAVEHLVENITGFVPPPPLPPAALSSPTAREQRMRNRAYAARMDAVSALVTSIVGERAPGVPAPGTSGASLDPGLGLVSTAYAQSSGGTTAGEHVQQARLQAGATDATDTPSYKEIQKAILEQTQRPEFYADLNDAGNSPSQKELYLRAYNAMLVFQLIEKQEKISNAYAIEAATMLQKYKDRGGGQRGEEPY